MLRSKWEKKSGLPLQLNYLVSGKEEIKAGPFLDFFSYFYSHIYALTLPCLHAD